MKRSDFDYVLPPEHIAQTPATPRDHARLLVLDRRTQTWQHAHFFEIGRFLAPNDLLIINTSKVFRARLQTVDGIEILLIRPDGDQWIAIGKPGKKLKRQPTLLFGDGTHASVVAMKDDGTIQLDFHRSPEEIFTWTEANGSVPLPPYIASDKSMSDDYQTVYAETQGSVAAPTAGLHFTPRLIEELKQCGVRLAPITLHVGLGTFRPIKTETLQEHEMHHEWLEVPAETVAAIEKTRATGGRVIAVGTTSVRALESGIQCGFTNLFITPGYHFTHVDGLITNFHLPASTLLVLVSAFAGREFILRAYTEAIRDGYRFYSFGDAMLIL